MSESATYIIGVYTFPDKAIVTTLGQDGASIAKEFPTLEEALDWIRQEEWK